MSRNYLANLEETALRVEHHIQHRTMQEGGGLDLLAADSSTGGVSVLATIPSGSFSRQRIRQDFNRLYDTEANYSEEFWVSVDAMATIETGRIIAIDHNGQRFQCQTPLAPQGLTQFWRILIRPTETI